jgi:hypothetical protein
VVSESISRPYNFLLLGTDNELTPLLLPPPDSTSHDQYIQDSHLKIFQSQLSPIFTGKCQKTNTHGESAQVINKFPVQNLVNTLESLSLCNKEKRRWEKGGERNRNLRYVCVNLRRN